MGQRVFVKSKLKLNGVGVAKASLKRALVFGKRPETEWSSHDQVEVETWRTEPTIVAKIGDELWLGVKG